MKTTYQFGCAGCLISLVVLTTIAGGVLYVLASAVRIGLGL